MFPLVAVLFLATSVSGVPSGKTVKLNNGVIMPSINLGTCCGSEPKVGLAPWLAAGGTGIDTAFDYRDQMDINNVIHNTYKPTPKRDSLFITTKVPAGFGNSTDCLPGQAGIDSAVNYVHENLRELGVTQVDLVLVHRPCQSKQTHDIKGSNQALWDGMLEVLKQNLTRAIGISNYEPADIEALDFRGVVPAVNQFSWSLQGRNDKQVAYCLEKGILPESYHTMKGCPFDNDTVKKIAAAHSVSAAQVCLRYILEKGGAIAAGTGSDSAKAPVYAKENLDIYGFSLTADEVSALDHVK